MRLIRRIVTAFLAIAVAWCFGTSSRSWAEDEKLATVDRLVADGQIESAVETAIGLGEELYADFNGIRSAARLARALDDVGRIDESIKFYRLAIAGSEAPSDESQTKLTTILRLAAAAVLIKAEDYDCVVETTKPVLIGSSVATPSQRRQAVSMCLRAGAGALADDALSTAEDAYAVALRYGQQDQQLTARLGFGWSALLAGHRSDEAVDCLATADQSGTATTSLLRQMPAADAEWLAAVLLSRCDQANWSAQAVNSAGRWAAGSGRWSLLAAAAESYQEPTDRKLLSTELVRWFAEALVQLHRGPESRQWWNYLVDDRQANDFAALLRCAEVETTYGHGLPVARRRIETARTATEDDPLRVAMVALLAAQYEIRRTSFAQARAILNEISQTPGLVASIRGRAMWLTGETYYLQREFPAAIEAYRQVEAIDPGGLWAGAALVQAGKSFEQLGRTQEASVCYGNLLENHAATIHAQFARRRLAAIAPPTDPTEAPDSSSTIRR